ncbi:MAG: ABC transporter permease [Actinobacteria bacterium]|nr:ABC transporter permease [Actinomycetota bacterium]
MSLSTGAAGMRPPTEASHVRITRARRHPLLWYAVRRCATGIVLALFVSLLVFLATQVLPGDSARAILGREANPTALAQLREQLGLNRPLVTQYSSWLWDLLHGDLGTSYASRGPVSDLLRDRIANTLILSAAALVIIIPLSLVLGAVAGVRRGKPVDHAISASTLAAVAVPEFVTGTLLAALLAVTWKLLPAVSLVPTGESPLAHLDILVLPVLALTISGLAANVRMVRGGVSDQMTSEYVEAARLNGIPEGRVIRRHVLRNSVAPSIQTFAMTVQWLVGGVIVVESVFQYPGIGQSLVAAVGFRDAAVVQSLGFLIALTYIVVNVIADIAVVSVIPKLRTAA